MMWIGLQTALSEITLVLFTTLAPAGAFAFVIVSMFLLIGKMSGEERQRVNHALSLPLVTSMVGLVASATHLGNPANALYVFVGVGRSPLSTEVFCAVIYLFLAGVYWLYSFARKPRLLVQKATLVLIVISGVVFITSVALAYSVETILTWNQIYPTLSLWLNAVVGGIPLALLTLQIAGAKVMEGRLPKYLLLLSAVAFVVNLVVLFIQNSQLGTLENSFASAAELVPFYGVVIVVYALLVASALLLYWQRLCKGGLPALKVSILICILIYIGIFLIRFSFYMMYMAEGVGL